MRNIAFMREGLGYGWQKSFTEALKKTNETYSRTLRQTPSEIQSVKGNTFYGRDMPEQPKRRKQPIFQVGDRVRHLLKSAMDVNTVLWKSYNAFRDPKTHIWSRTVFPVTAKRRKGRTTQYTVNKKDFYPWQLQKIEGKVRVIKAPEKKNPRKSREVRQKDPKAEISQSNVRTSRRVRKKPQRYGF